MQVLELCNITYLPSSDGADLNLPDASFDCHLSNCTLEHASAESVGNILHSASRLLRPGGICAHRIDHSDHYAHLDAGRLPIDLLRFSDHQWLRNDRLTHTNRLRVSEYLPLFQNVGLDILTVKDTVDDECVNLIKTGAFPLAQRFNGYSAHDLATLDSIVTAVPRR